MPRVNGVMQLPPGTYGAPGTTIKSDKYNAAIDDFVAEMNSARPVTAGGSGATTPAGARTNLGIALPIVFTSSGGDETTPLGTVAEIRLAAAFTAVAPTAIMHFSCSISSYTGLSYLAFMQGAIRDATNGFTLVAATTEQVVSGGAAQVISMARTLVMSNLTVGITYQPVLKLRSNTANTFTPQGMTINGWNG